MCQFLKGIREYTRIGPTHIRLLAAILQYAEKRQMHNPICIFSKELMERARILGAGTFIKISGNCMSMFITGTFPPVITFRKSYLF